MVATSMVAARGSGVDGRGVDGRGVEGRGVDVDAAPGLPLALASARRSVGLDGLRRRWFGSPDALRTFAAGAGAGSSAGAGAGAAGAVGRGFGSFLPCIARCARALGAFGGAFRSIGLVILSVIRAMGERPARTASTGSHHSSCRRRRTLTIDSPARIEIGKRMPSAGTPAHAQRRLHAGRANAKPSHVNEHPRSSG